MLRNAATLTLAVPIVPTPAKTTAPDSTMFSLALKLV